MGPAEDGNRGEVTRLLALAMELEGEERVRFLGRQTPGQRQTLERLLALTEEGHGAERVQQAVDQLMTSILSEPDIPQPVPRWRLIEPIGRGGMAEVFRAERADGASKQRAAVKIIWPGMMSGSLRARFGREREILAELTHPNIARLLDGGMSSDGRPWLATELVDGEPIDRHCDRAGASLEERLRLFKQVCEAIAHAHRKLVVHRDIKPENILVNEESQAKLLDFGIAKLIPQEAEDSMTRDGDRMLTPGYSSPEQLEGRAIDTRSDIFQLGMLLYQLVWGRHPFISEDMNPIQGHRANIDAVMPAYARHALSPRGASGRLPSELHSIATKALSAEPDRRYGSVEQLLEDLKRLSDGVPISARPPSRWYRLRKFVGRHAIATALTAALATALAGYAALMATQNRRLAEESAINRAVGQFMASMRDAEQQRSADADFKPVSQMLREEVQRVTQDLADLPVAQARVLHLLASIFLVDESLDGNTPGVARALAMAYESRSIEEHLQAVFDTAYVANFSGAHEEAVVLLDGLLALRSNASPNDRLALNTRALLGDLLHSLGRYRQALDAMQPAVEVSPRHSRLYQSLGMALRELGRFEESAAAIERSQSIARELHGEDTLQYAATLEHSGWLGLVTGDYARAERDLTRALNLRLEKTPSGHIWSRHWLGTLSFARGDYERALDLINQAVAAYERFYSSRSQLYAYAQSDLGWVHVAQGRLSDAEAAFRTARDTLLELQSGRHFRLAEPLVGLGAVAAANGDGTAARRYVQEAMSIRRQQLPVEHPFVSAICWLFVDYGGSCDLPEAPRPGLDGVRIQLAQSLGTHLGG